MQTQITKLPARQANLEIGHDAIYVERNLGPLGMPHGADMIRYADITDVSVKSGFLGRAQTCRNPSPASRRGLAFRKIIVQL